MLQNIQCRNFDSASIMKVDQVKFDKPLMAAGNQKTSFDKYEVEERN
jgi:hypothetical protein